MLFEFRSVDLAAVLTRALKQLSLPLMFINFFAEWALASGIKSAGMNLQNSTHRGDRILLESCLYERVFFFDSSAKNTVASFRISLS